MKADFAKACSDKEGILDFFARAKENALACTLSM